MEPRDYFGRNKMDKSLSANIIPNYSSSGCETFFGMSLMGKGMADDSRAGLGSFAFSSDIILATSSGEKGVPFLPAETSPEHFAIS
jgi:hypothetical protein